MIPLALMVAVAILLGIEADVLIDILQCNPNLTKRFLNGNGDLLLTSSHQEIILQSTTLSAGALGVVLLEQWIINEFSTFAGIASTISAIGYLMTPYRRRIKPECTLANQC